MSLTLNFRFQSTYALLGSNPSAGVTRFVIFKPNTPHTRAGSRILPVAIIGIK